MKRVEPNRYLAAMKMRQIQYTENPSTMLEMSRLIQEELIEHYYERMDPETQARATKTIVWLRDPRCPPLNLTLDIVES